MDRILETNLCNVADHIEGKLFLLRQALVAGDPKAAKSKLLALECHVRSAAWYQERNEEVQAWFAKRFSNL